MTSRVQAKASAHGLLLAIAAQQNALLVRLVDKGVLDSSDVTYIAQESRQQIAGTDNASEAAKKSALQILDATFVAEILH